MARRIEILAVLALTLGTDTGIALAPYRPSTPNSSRSPVESLPRKPVNTPGTDTRYHPGSSEIRYKLVGLSPLRPLAPGKIPVVLVDGLWGSPRRWAPMVKALEADPLVRGQFQFFTFSYTTSDPIPYSAHLLRRSLRALRDRSDPERTDPSWDRMVLIGHSMGGLLCKMMTQESGSKLWDLTALRPFEKLEGPADARELLQAVMDYKPVPEVKRLIFIATPHRGSPLVWGPIREIGIRLVRPPAVLEQARVSLLATNGSDVFTPGFRAGLPTSIAELAWEHPLLLAIDSHPREHETVFLLNF